MNDVLEGAALPRVWPVGVLCRAIGRHLDEGFNPITVVGEIAGFSRASSGHCYFTLKDASGQLRCAMFRRAAASLVALPQDGDLVEVSGRLGVYEARGELQMVVEVLQRAGQGNLYERFLKIKELLQSEGLFEQSRKRTLPLQPRGIGVVTSLGSAAMHDVATTLQRRVPHIPVLVFSSSVQGTSAPQELIYALQNLYGLANRPKSPGGFDLDVILLVRGGGSLEDLWAFNDEELARTIASSPVPIVCGVGHETDFTIADFVADLRAPTPTAAAELVAESATSSLQFCTALESRLEQVLHKYLNGQSQRMDWLHSHLVRPSSALNERRLSLESLLQNLRRSSNAQINGNRLVLDRLTQQIGPSVDRVLMHEKSRLEQASIRLGMLDPLLVLQRGYVWLSAADGRQIRNASELSIGQRVRATLADGTVDLTVLDSTPN